MRRSRTATSLLCFLLVGPCLGGPPALAGDAPWARHVIDAGSRGADGVKLADLTGDGLPDIVTGWEEGGEVRVAINPGRSRAKEPWPCFAAGRARSVEDAVPVDLDGDGAIDIVSACEGSERTLFVYWAPRDRGALRDEAAWRRESFPVSKDLQAWMFAAPADIDGQRGIDIVCGGKGPGAAVGWLEAPPDPRDVAAWKWHPLREAGWIMSLHAIDLDGDGDRDILLSDRKGPRSGCSWLENPRLGAGSGSARPERGGAEPPWVEHPIGGGGEEVMFVSVTDLDGDGLRDVLAAVKPRSVLFLRAAAPGALAWETIRLSLPEEAGTSKAVAAGDLDLDGKAEIVVTCEDARGDRWGVLGLSPVGSPREPLWKAFDIGGREGTKHDLVELLDLDGDGDLDVLTCEETDGLGVVWYENPARVPLELRVRVPEGSASGTIFVAGSAPEVGRWSPAGLPLEPGEDGVHVARFGLPPGYRLEFKVTRGSWETVEKGKDGEEVPNRVAVAGEREVAEVSVLSWRKGDGATRRRSTIAGIVKVHDRFRSRFLEDERRLLVYLPPGYETASEARYPVIYFQDGQNVFDAATAAFGVEWGADETLERLIAEGQVRPVIAVAIDNTPARLSEYAPPGKEAPPDSPAAKEGPGRHAVPKGDLYVRFVAEEVKPFIDGAYRTLRGPEHTAIVGSSMGGLIALHALRTRRDTFGLCGALSPSLWWDGRACIESYREGAAGLCGARLWIDAGTEEGAGADRGRALSDVMALGAVLEGAGLRPGKDFRCFEAKEGRHDEASWAARLDQVLRFLFEDVRG